MTGLDSTIARALDGFPAGTELSFDSLRDAATAAQLGPKQLHGQMARSASSTEPRTAERIQRKRSKGWKMPEGAVYVGRPSKWGNPFQVLPRSCGCWDVEDENGVTYLLEPSRHASFCSDTWSKRFAARDAVDLFAGLYYGDRLARERDMSDVRDALRGKDLACWCPLDQPCHADVLLEIANGGNA